MCMTFIWLFMSSKSQVSVDNFLCQLFVFFYDQTLTLKIDLCFIYDVILANEQKDVLIGTYPYFIHDRRLWPVTTIASNRNIYLIRHARSQNAFLFGGTIYSMWLRWWTVNWFNMVLFDDIEHKKEIPY